METKLYNFVELGRENLVNSIARVDISSLTPKIFFEKYQKLGIPAIVTGLLANEPDWNLDFLCQKLGDREVPIRHYGRDRYKQDKRNWKSIGSGIATQNIPFSEYAALLRNHQAHEKDLYLGKGSIKNTPLTDTSSLKSIGEKLGLKPASDYKLYMGPGGHTANLHYDIMDGTLVQLHGAKKIVLFPPAQTGNLYPFPVHIHLRHGLRMRCCYSQVCPDNPNLHLFPKFQKAVLYKYEAILNQGEIIYIPAYWWHEITTLAEEMSCSVTRFWRVYPTSRAMFSWSRWRSILGNVLGLPNVAIEIAIAIFSSNRKQKIRQILSML